MRFYHRAGGIHNRPGGAEVIFEIEKLMRHIGLPPFHHHAHGSGRGYPGGAGDVYGYLVGTGGGEPQRIRRLGLAVHRPGERVNDQLVFPHRIARSAWSGLPPWLHLGDTPDVPPPHRRRRCSSTPDGWCLGRFTVFHGI